MIEELKIIVLILVAYHTTKIYLDSKRDYPPLDYSHHSTANSEGWRWRKPSVEMNLHLQDDAQSSHIFLESTPLMAEKIFMVLGYMMIVFALIALLKRLFAGDADGTVYIIILVFLGLGYGALNVGKYVSRIILYRDKVEFIEEYGFFLRRVKSYRLNPKLDFNARQENFLELTSDHEYPRTRLYLKEGWLFSKLFNLACNPTQAHWIVEGLEAWKQEVLKYE